MTNDEEQEQEQGKPRVIVHWNTSQFRPTIYDIDTFRLMKQKPKGVGTDGSVGYSKVFNPNTSQYESPASIDLLPPARKKKQQQQQPPSL